MNNMWSATNKKKRSPAPISASSKKTAKTAKPSPDSVACIDLTGSNWEDCVIDSEKKRRFGAIRKELEPPSARKGKKGDANTTGLGNSKHNEIIIIDSDDEDNNVVVSE